ncbi:hypothetical protein GW17_00011623 [Ensete ventricosum]|nr:hypothetical protein GW17_00011623 [Ensete ventricosum]RZR91847.1 hypothetical protein BHM03_00020037 [Ensete ventricosum]
MSTFGKWSLVPNITTKVSLPNEIFNMVFEVVAFLGVMPVLLMETTISSLVSPLGMCLDWIERPEGALLSNLEENLHPSRVKRDDGGLGSVSSSGAGGQGVSPRGWLTNRVTVMLKVPTLPRSGGVAVHKVGLRYGLILLGKGQFGLHLLGSRPGSELLGDHWGHKLQDVWDDDLHHSGKCLDLVGEAKETSAIMTGGPIFIVGGENHGSLNSLQ